ncbi:Protease PrtS precursor [compost metagenome]
MGGFAWEKAGLIWYDALCDKRLGRETSFSAFAELTVEHARRRFTAREALAVQHGWSQVGVDSTQEEP